MQHQADFLRKGRCKLAIGETFILHSKILMLEDLCFSIIIPHAAKRSLLHIPFSFSQVRWHSEGWSLLSDCSNLHVFLSPEEAWLACNEELMNLESLTLESVL